MNLITADHITKAYGVRKLFDDTSFFLQEGEKVGVLGINGTGKSTLLKMLVGVDEPDEGNIIRARGYVIAYLEQTPVYDDDQTILDAVLQGTKKEESDAKSMLTKLGVTDFDRTCKGLSGGEIKRLALVNALLMSADILILDEPTNHLDQGMADWLEDTLKQFRGSMIMITHDRYFLDSVCNRIIEVDKGKIYSYESNYEGYLELKAEREEMQRASDRKRHSILRTELKWVQRGARARSTHQKARLQRYEQMSRVADAAGDESVTLGSMSSRLGRSTIELNNITKGYGDRTLIRDFSYLFLKNDRIGFLGPNGCGKSTLMKMILGEEQPDFGTISIGQTVKIGYFAQSIGEDEMRPQQKVIDYIRDVAEYVETPDGKISATKLLEEFLFEGEDQYGPVGKLSGGQRRRLYLCKVLMSAPNVLIMDEPTNDLDVTTLQILEDYLDRFQGIVILVSHDRYFLDRVVGRLFVFGEDGNLIQSEGGYTDYCNRMRLSEEADPGADKRSTATSKKGKEAGGNADSGAKDTGKKWNADRVRKLKFTYAEQKEYETIEAQIEELETRIEELDREMAASGTDYGKLRKLSEEKEEKELLLLEKMDRWMYLEDLAKRIAEQ